MRQFVMAFGALCISWGAHSATCDIVRDGGLVSVPCTAARPPPVTYLPATATAIAVANTPVTVFAPLSVANGCDVVNTGSGTLYLDFAALASAGASTSIPLAPGQSYHCPFAPIGAVTAVATQPQSFVAVRY